VLTGERHPLTMAIHLDHLIVPSRNRKAVARLIAQLLDVPWTERGQVGPFSPVYLNPELTLDFDEWPEPIPKQLLSGKRARIRRHLGANHRRRHPVPEFAARSGRQSREPGVRRSLGVLE
jgi:hypothetical protein